MAVFGVPRAELERDWLPQRPQAAPTKDGIPRYVTREVALEQFAYIQPNPPCLRSLIITDVDHDGAAYVSEEAGMPAPSFATVHPIKGTGHVTYALLTPVCVTDAARRGPVNLLARVESGLRDVLGGDPGYAGARTKNPLHPQHVAVRLWDEEYPRYSLRDLASPLADVGALPRWDDTKRIRGTEIGRNVALFDVTRSWAYKAIKRHWGAPREEWFEVVEAYAWMRNLGEVADQYAVGPLSRNEVHHLARSIAKWTWTRFTPEKFSEIQSYRGKKRAAQRRENTAASIEGFLS